MDNSVNVELVLYVQVGSMCSMCGDAWSNQSFSRFVTLARTLACSAVSAAFTLRTLNLGALLKRARKETRVCGAQIKLVKLVHDWRHLTQSAKNCA